MATTQDQMKMPKRPATDKTLAKQGSISNLKQKTQKGFAVTIPPGFYHNPLTFADSLLDNLKRKIPVIWMDSTGFEKDYDGYAGAAWDNATARECILLLAAQTETRDGLWKRGAKVYCVDNHTSLSLSQTELKADKTAKEGENKEHKALERNLKDWGRESKPEFSALKGWPKAWRDDLKARDASKGDLCKIIKVPAAKHTSAEIADVTAKEVARVINAQLT